MERQRLYQNSGQRQRNSSTHSCHVEEQDGIFPRQYQTVPRTYSCQADEQLPRGATTKLRRPNAATSTTDVDRGTATTWKGDESSNAQLPRGRRATETMAKKLPRGYC
ncbi:hypothetical protein CBR_g38624 [Chara braunii]|uniref:Uncharacterized protein n=1 Tax=Chara braunii TaxID=69332 RepID=A0A388K0K0_CHABU|nr:hypothetical protein CBR_g38624 [Chara braunii]|eukprot:GBG63557.1 hypothetical protein CBR_g38624 [Chara braunii]